MYYIKTCSSAQFDYSVACVKCLGSKSIWLDQEDMLPVTFKFIFVCKTPLRDSEENERAPLKELFTYSIILLTAISRPCPQTV